MPVYIAHPNWADPSLAKPDDPLYKEVARRVVNLAGLSDPNAIMGVAGGLAIPKTTVGSLPPSTPKDLLLELLNRYTGEPGSPVPPRVGGSVPKPTTTTDLFKALVERNPDLKRKFVPPPNLELPRPTKLVEQFKVEQPWKKSVGRVDNPLSAGLQKLKRSGLTEQDVLDIRSMPIEASKKLYPHLKEPTLVGIKKLDSFGWVK